MSAGCRSVLLPLTLALSIATARAQGLDVKDIYQPLGANWPTYAGDYTGQRHSNLTQINQPNVHNLALAWVAHLPVTQGGSANSGVPTQVGGVVETAVPFSGPGSNGPRVGGSILAVNGVLYASAPDHAWAIDAHDGRVLWHYFWKTRGGDHIGNRGMAMAGNRLYFEVPDDFLISLDATSGKELWHREIADFNRQYFSTSAPVIVDDHLLLGTGNNVDAPGFIKSLNLKTNADEWQWFTTPHDKGDPGADSWPSVDTMRHGGGNVWIPGVFDPQLRLYYLGTGNPNPVMSAKIRTGDNLFTCSLVAINVDTGKMAWYYQVSPHDTHDYDAAQTPILVDGVVGGRARKLLLDGYRGGYFFVIDRETGEHLMTSKIADSVNWTSGINARGQPIRDPLKDAQPGGALVSPSNPGIVNWPPATVDPGAGLFYVQTGQSYSIFFQTDSDPRAAEGFSGVREEMAGNLGRSLIAMDYRTGKMAWKIDYPMSYGAGPTGLPGLLSTASGLLFGADANGNLVARDSRSGRPLWHSRLGAISNAPETFLVDGRQLVLVASNDTLYAFRLNN